MSAKGVLLTCLCSMVIAVGITLLTIHHSPAISAQVEKQIVAESISIVDPNGVERVSLGYEEGAAVIKLSNHLRNDIELRAEPDGTCSLHVSGTAARLALDELDGGYFNLMTVDQSGVSYFASDLEDNHSVQLRLADERCSFGMDSSDGVVMISVDEMSVVHTASTGWGGDAPKYFLLLSPSSASLDISDGAGSSVRTSVSDMTTSIWLENGRHSTMVRADDPADFQPVSAHSYAFGVYATNSRGEENAAGLADRLEAIGIPVLGVLEESDDPGEPSSYRVGEFENLEAAQELEKLLTENGFEAFCTRSEYYSTEQIDFDGDELDRVIEMLRNRAAE